MPDKTENQITNKFKINHWLKINVNESLEKNWQMCLLNLNLISIYPKLVASLSIFSEEQHWQRVANTRTESELIKFIDNLNQKHPIIKFEFTYSRTRITFLDTKVYKNENGTLRTTIYRKPSDCRKFFHYKSAHPKELKHSIPYSQALRIKRICQNLKDLKDAFIKRCYHSKILDYHFERAMNVDRKVPLEIKENPSTQGHLPLVLTYNKTLPNSKNVIDKHWHILSINENLQKVFDKRPFIAYRRNTNLFQIIGGNRIFKNKVVRKNTKQPKQSGNCPPCLSRLNNLCCKQMKQAKTFPSQPNMQK